MAENTKIEWASHSWSPWRGCTKVSAGCKNCYADTLSKRNPLSLGVWGPNGTRVVAAESAWKLPLKWNREFERAWEAYSMPARPETPPPERPRVFLSLCDPFEDWQGPMVDAQGRTLCDASKWIGCGTGYMPSPMKIGRDLVTMSDVRRRLFRLIAATPNLDWLILSKRPENMLRMMGPEGVGLYAHANGPVPCPQPNLWLGTSVEDQATADERIPHLLRVPAAVRFLSVEPLLSDVNIRRYFHHSYRCPAYVPPPEPVSYRGCKDCTCEGRISWVIVGGESGPGARPCNVEWIRDIVRQCREAWVPCFVKQLGSNVVDRNDRGFDALCETWAEGPDEGKPTDPEAWPGMPDIEEDLDGTRDGYQGAPVRVRLRDRKGGDPSEWPLDLQVREMPVRTEAP